MTVSPQCDESWDSFLTRTATANHTTVAALCERIGLLKDGRWPAFYGVIVDPQWRSSAAEALRTEPNAVDRMHLSVYDKIVFDLDGLGSRRDFRGAREVTAHCWVFLTGSRYCPQCLSAGGAWRLSWRLPWITTCSAHGSLLRHRCLHCGSLSRSGKSGHATRPCHHNAPAGTELCGQTQRVEGRLTRCDADLTLATSPSADHDALSTTDYAAAVIATGNGTVLGEEHPALETFRAWRAAAAYARALRVVTAPEEDFGNPRRPPRASRDMAQIQAAGLELLQAPDSQSGAAVLERWCETTGVRPAPAVFDDAAVLCPELRPAVDTLMRRSGRSHSILARSLDQIEPQSRIDLADLGSDDIPQLIWPCALDRDLQMSSRPSALLLRAVVSLALARIAGARGWGDAAFVLGWRAADGKAWSRYVFASKNGSLKQRLIASAVALAPLLREQPHRGRWAERLPTTGRTLQRLAASQHAACRVAETASVWCPCLAVERERR